MAQQDCLFCKVVDGGIPATIVRSDEHTVAFRDINPQAPVHVLVVPRDHHPDVASLSETDPELASRLLEAAAAVAEAEGVSEGWRLVFNTGESAGQSVFHVHAHVIGGRDFAWPPG